MVKKQKSSGPLKADEVEDAKSASIPPEVFEVFNDLITKDLSGGQAVVKQDDVVAALVSRMEVTRQVIFDNGWLNVEHAYEKAGWHVEYDKPGFNESYPATFTFTKRNKR